MQNFHSDGFCFSSVIADHFSGPGRAIGRVFVYVSGQ